MKRLFILLVVFCATCINTYASNHSAGKNSDAEYASCNIQTMLTDPKSPQWFRPQCVRILATRVERGNMSQNEKEQLKKVLVPAFYNIMEQYVYLTGDRAKEESPYFMALYKSLTQLADAKGTYGLVRSDGFMFLEKGKTVEGRSTQAEIVGKKSAVFNFGKLTGDVLNKKVELKLAQKEEDPFWGKKRAPGELTKGLSDGKDGGIVPAFDVSHLESVFLFEQDSKLEEKDFVFDVQILNNMLKERRDFRPLLTFMAENASFNKKHINYIPPRFVRLVLAYYAESLFPAEQTKLMDYVTNPKYSKPFRFLAATVAAAYAYNDDYKDFYEGKFSYYPQEAVAILEVLRTVKTDNPKETVRLELLGNRVFRYVKGQLLLPVEKNKKTEWLEKAALGRALDKTISSAEFISVASASAPETLLTAGGILVIGGAVYTVSAALSPMYRAQFHDLLDRLTSVEVPETYVPEDLKAKYPIVNGKIRVPVKEGFAQTLPPSSLQGEVYEDIELDELGERAAIQNFIVWSDAYYTKIGEDARSVSRTSNKKNITCVYAYTPPGSPWQLNQLSAVANPGDTLSKVRLQKLYQCMSGTSYCKGQTKRTARKNKNSKGKIDFSECAAVDLDKIQAPPECQKDFKELAAAWKVSRSFQEPSGLKLYTRAIYRPLYGGWVPEAEISIKTLDGLHKVLAQWIYDQIFDKFSILIKSEKPLSLGRNAFYRNGAHEWSRWYDENLQSVSRDNSTYQHFHYEEMKTYQNNKNYVCNHVIFVHK